MSIAHSLRAFAFLVLVFASHATAQPRIYVDAGASGRNDGSTWEDAYVDLQDALAAAGNPAQIWVAAGTYYPTRGTDRAATFRLKSGVAVLGGFSGAEASADERDPLSNKTVLSGDIGAESFASDNSYHVVTALGVDETAVLDGFTVYFGVANGAAPYDRGAGLTNSDGTASPHGDEGYPTIRNVEFLFNAAVVGGGVYLHAARDTVRFQNVTFDNNYSFEDGGGLYAHGRFDLRLDAVTFDFNYAQCCINAGLGGGAFLADSVRVTGRDLVWANNYAQAGGGGLYLERATAELRGAVFEGNRVHLDGSTGGALYAVESDLVIIDGHVERNETRGEQGFGAGLSVERSRADLVNVAFLGNRGTSNGQDLQVYASDVAVANATFVGGDGLYRILNTVGSSLRLTNVAYAAASDRFVLNSTSRLEVNNAVLWPVNVPSVTITGTLDSVAVRHAIVKGGFTGGTAVLSADPRFARLPGPGADGRWNTDDDDYGDLRLEPGSPALDFGSAALLPQDTYDLDGDGVTGVILPYDLSGKARIEGAAVDLGPYEGAFTPVAADDAGAAPGPVALAPPFPNPARDRAVLPLTVPAAAHVDAALYDVLGRRVVRLHAGPMAAGAHTLEVDVAALPAGLYVVRVVAGGATATRRLTVVR